MRFQYCDPTNLVFPCDFLPPPCLHLGEELLPKVLDELKVALIVGIGEGAGANVLVRFALTNQQRTLGKPHTLSTSCNLFPKQT